MYTLQPEEERQRTHSWYRIVRLSYDRLGRSEIGVEKDVARTTSG